MKAVGPGARCQAGGASAAGSDEGEAGGDALVPLGRGAVPPARTRGTDPLIAPVSSTDSGGASSGTHSAGIR